MFLSRSMEKQAGHDGKTEKKALACICMRSNDHANTK